MSFPNQVAARATGLTYEARRLKGVTMLWRVSVIHVMGGKNDYFTAKIHSLKGRPGVLPEDTVFLFVEADDLNEAVLLAKTEAAKRGITEVRGLDDFE